MSHRPIWPWLVGGGAVGLGTFAVLRAKGYTKPVIEFPDTTPPLNNTSITPGVVQPATPEMTSDAKSVSIPSSTAGGTPVQTVSIPGGDPTVRAVQEALAKSGINPGPIDGRYGGHTAQGIKQFQSAHGLSATGILDVPTAQAMAIPIPAPPARLGANFVGMLAQQVAGICSAIDACKLMIHESGLNSSSAYRVTNSDGSVTIVACGIFGLLTNTKVGSTADTQVIPLLGMTTTQFMALSPVDQLPFAGKFWRQMTARFSKPMAGRDMYWMNYLPACVVQGAGDDYTFVKSDDTYMTPDKAWHTMRGVYTMNSGLDHGKKGFITAGDMVMALDDGAMANPVLFLSLANALAQQNVA